AGAGAAEKRGGGPGAACPADAKSTAECRPAAGDCDVAESCDGVSDTCPPDVFAPPTTVCRPPAGDCDLEESCTGAGPDCPPDSKSTAEGRPAAGPWDGAESCGGTSAAWPPDHFAPATAA